MGGISGRRSRSVHFLLSNITCSTETYTLSLHDALPISQRSDRSSGMTTAKSGLPDRCAARYADEIAARLRSEEHTSELQSHHDLVCRLLLEKKKKTQSAS